MTVLEFVSGVSYKALFVRLSCKYVMTMKIQLDVNTLTSGRTTVKLFQTLIISNQSFYPSCFLCQFFHFYFHKHFPLSHCPRISVCAHVCVNAEEELCVIRVWEFNFLWVWERRRRTLCHTGVGIRLPSGVGTQTKNYVSYGCGNSTSFACGNAEKEEETS